jgi:SAM-dependent methyltransferase
MSGTIACVVCGTPSGDPIYASDGSSSLTSGARIASVRTVVRVCRTCAHIQTEPLANIDAYYDVEYNANLESETADDLYIVRDHRSVYRSEHQAAVALDKLALAPGARLLDYGAAKATTARRMLRARPDLELALFDVSDNYRAYWSEFVSAGNQASFVLPAAWDGRFDAITSFFALEHVAEPRPFLARIRELLAPGGQVHIVVPNVRENTGDFVVVDHVNHFMPSSLRFALEAAGFTALRIDESAHVAAYVINARRAESFGEPQPDPRTPEYVAGAERLGTMWRGAAAKIQTFELQHAGRYRAAIYGSGFYGAFICNSLRDRSSVAYFLDRNPHQQAKRVFDLSVIAPDDVGDDIDVLYLGLNPARAKAIIATVSAIHRRQRDIFMLE